METSIKEETLGRKLKEGEEGYRREGITQISMYFATSLQN